ncbi:hypothetical protein LTR91_007667 [Friedmanniomyces endolithicus]|uniref:DUF6699 domain-containing protein n=1 Tax=Friedmanniomyces endolithicus TaxID=329885 RepID=A0A4U0V2N1_9PEZI|nr:hypothetical protein LTS09_007125 [Friedmanniomyces endolithicus]KAK0274069.1 hypothetical protein LTR35_011862 [Friedmanniomyces endolithicus]KAK0293257.1 hypothetical protein LTS00_007503 [Friedmanniomyces endolithicus]KAK0304248.1 hypothetical protein LTR01_007604 [Friedmanniomyces endolithicus]KAK0306880.1 hypothetical protein LTR82_016207 [Friedmanniomyces endolithicus]
MAAEVQEPSAPLSKVDSAIDDAPASPGESKPRHRRTSSTVSGVFNINDLEKEGVELKIAPETQKLNWKVNSSPATIDEKEILHKLLCHPPIKKIDLHFPLGLEVTARNMKGVTIKDACDAIYKQFKKKADDELENPYLAGFEWDREECYTKFIVHQKKTGDAPSGGSGKKKKAKAGEEA